MIIFKQLLNSNSELIINYLAPEIFAKPITPFKTEILMSNADILAPQLYENDLSVIFCEVFTDKENEERLLYCIN